MKKNKVTIPKLKQRRLKAKSVQGAIKKSPILLLQHWKNE